MADAGLNERLRRHVAAKTKNTDNGEEEITYTPGAYYWCLVEWNNGRRDTRYGAVESGADVIVRVRQFPALSALDRLETADGIMLHLESVIPGDNEWVCQASMLDSMSEGI